MKKYGGIYTALVTPFNQNGKINTKVLQKLVEDNLAKGVSGFYVSGSTGESYLLSVEERKYLLEAVMEAAAGRAEVIVNIGMFATEHALELARHAERQQVSAVSSVPPFYFPFNKREIIQYYKDLAGSLEVPVLVYNIPAMSSVNFTQDDLAELLEQENILGIKHTSYDLFQLQQLINMYPDKSIFCGHDELFLSALAVGTEAGIGSTYNIMADKFIKLMDFYHSGQMNLALNVQNEINQMVTVLCKVGVFKGIKEILRMQGMDCGDCRRPFLPLREEEKEELKTVAGMIHII